MHFLFFSSLTTTFECHSQFWQKRQQCLLFSVLLLVWYCHRPFCTLFSSIDLSVWKLSTFPNICFCNCKSNFFDDCQTAVVPFLSHFSAVGCQLLSRRHLPSPCHLQTSCVSTSSVLIPGLVTPNNQQISLVSFLHRTLWVQIKYSHHVWVWTLYCGKLLDSETVLCHNYPLSASYRVLVWKMCWMGVNITDGCVCVCTSLKNLGQTGELVTRGPATPP